MAYIAYRYPSSISKFSRNSNTFSVLSLLVLGAIAMMLLGFSSSTGGEAAYANSIAHDESMFGSEFSGYGSLALAIETTGPFASNSTTSRFLLYKF